MKKSFFKRAVSLVCAAAITLGIFAGAAKPVFAAGATLGYWPEPLEIPNEYYYENTTLQPYGSCFQIDELKNWSPDNDPDARYNRSSIPLAERWMGPNVNPLASRDAKVMPLAMANARASQAPSQGGDGVSAYVFNNFQYVDIYNFWGGSSGEGPIAIPSPEVIDSAHRNGVPATGTIFLPWGDSTYGNQFVREMVEKDENGNFIAADKLIEIAQYYGFDGYIFNAESGTGIAGFKEFLIYLQENKPENFTITWYNGSGGLSEGSIDAWMQDGDTRVTDHWWLDMSGNGNVDGTIEAARASGVDPWNIHSTWEYWPMSGMSGTKGGNYQTRLDENGMLKCSLGILAPTCTLTQATSPEDFLNVQDQKLWVGPSFDPSSTNRPENQFCGFASLVADRTPVIGTDFVTNFTAGNGYKFYENGEVVGKENGWFNRSLTDVLPTWRWIIESEGPMKLDAGIDYADAWYGGSSMKLSGTMLADQANHVKLYSAQLEITEETTFSFTYKTPVAGVDVELGLCFGDTYDAENFKFYPLTTTADGQWNTTSIDLSGDAGKTAIAISLRFNAPGGVTGYAINVGQMAFTTDNTAPEATPEVTLDEVIYPTDKTMEARVYWQDVENAFMYRIYRVHTDGTREFVGATPSDAFYLGSYEKEAGETAVTFEIVSYSENFVKGGTQTFTIAWPEEVENGFVPVFDEGPNLALRMPAVSSVACVADGPVHQINDGTVLNGSKWCSQYYPGYAVIDLGENKTIQRWVVYHANCPGAGESVDMNTVAFDLQYAPDDGQPMLTGDDNASQTRIRSISFTQADAVTNNKQDITDRNLDEPITARYIKLNVTDPDNSAWSAIRIYEFEVYEKAAINNAASPYERNVTVKNNAGASDTVVVDNVQMIYSSGTYSDFNGVFHEDTGKVRLFTDLTSEEPIAVAKAIQPNEGYKQRGVGIVKFEDLELDPDGGRLYYDVLDGSGPEVVNSRRASVYYAPESGTAPTAPTAPTSVTLERTTAGYQLRDQYGKLTATGLEEGAVLWIYESEDADTALLRTLPAEDGVASITRVPLKKTGGSVFYEIHVEGKPVSELYQLTYADPMELSADCTGLVELITKCEAISEDQCTTATWPAFAAELAAAKTVAASSPKASEAEAARAALAEAYANLRFKANTQRLAELCAQYAAYEEVSYTPVSWEVFAAALKAAQDAIAADDSSAFEVEQLRIDLEAAVRGLRPSETVTITGVTVSPAAVDVAMGGTQQFTATVNGTGGPSQAVTWTLSGNASADTTLVDGLLTVAKDETAATLTVTATAVANSSYSGTATVNVVEPGTEPTDPVDPPVSGELEEINSALNATIIAYNGTKMGTAAGPEKLFNGSNTDENNDKWCEDGKNLWVAFDIGEAKRFGQLKLLHAGANNEWSPTPGAVNTEAYEFYVLDTSKITEEALLAMSFADRTALLADNTYWTLIASRTGNLEDITTDDLTAEGRFFKLNVSDTDSAGRQACVRLYEVEMYAYAPVAEPELLSQGAAVIGTGTASVPGEEVEKAFDGSYSTKWCSKKTPNYVVFDVKEAAVADRLVVTHAGGAVNPEDERFNTNDFALYVLDQEQYTDEAFLALDAAAKSAVMNDDTCWTELKRYTGNEQNVTDDALSTETASRIYRLKVTDGDDNWWNGPDTIRIYEIELYGKKVTTQPPVEEVTITIDPTEMTVDNNPGQKGQFTAVVTGTSDVTVTWTISGNTSDGTMIGNGQLFLGDGETAKELNVTATSNADPTKSASATVYVVAPVYTIEISGDITGGTVTTDKTEAEAGEIITVTATPDQGYSLVEGSLKANGVVIENGAFVMPNEDVILTAVFNEVGNGDNEALLEAARAALAAAQEAQRKAQEAQEAAEEAQQAAEEAAASAAADKEAAELARQEAEEAQKAAEEAQAAAEEAQKAAEDAAAAAEQSNLEAAEEARKAAASAAEAAESAAEAANYAAEAAEAMRGAQEAQEAAEAAQAAAEEARKKAQEAQAAAEEAAASTAEDKEAAEKAKQEAEEAQAAAEEAQQAAEAAASAADTALEAAKEHELAAAASAAEAAEYALEVAERYEEICAMKAEMAQYLLDAQKAAEEAQKARDEALAAELASAKYVALMELALYAETADCPEALEDELKDIVKTASDAIAAAEDRDTVTAVLTEAKAQIDALCVVLPYTDVAPESWYYSATRFVYSNGLFKGVTDTTFAPNATMNRAMMVTVLYRLAGEPEVSGSTTFTDVNTEAYYYNALVWAGENGIVTGIDETTFAPFASVTREQMVTFLYRYAQYAGADVTAAADLTGFADRDQLGNYAKAPMAWAVAEGIIYGVTDTTLAPKATATRAQVAAILMRLVEG